MFPCRIMSTRSEAKRLLKLAVGPVVAACVAVYFGYHALAGERGALSLMKIERRIAEVQVQYDVLREHRRRLELRASQLRQDPADADLLDEYVRALLHVGRPDEIVILLDADAG